MMELEMNPKRFELETRTIAKALEMRRRFEEEADPESRESRPTLPMKVFEKVVRARATLSAFLTW
jgi:hypothetical protein